MFTGLVEGTGTISSLQPEGDAAVRLAIEVPDFMAGECTLGESVAINGCCLTVVEFTDAVWQFQAGEETLSKTNLGELEAGSLVNLERSLKADTRLGGHFVQGHIDGTGQVQKIDRDGISLTLVDVEPESFSVALIPHTLEVTTLGQREVGDSVNIEADMLGKYIYKMVANLDLGKGVQGTS